MSGRNIRSARRDFVIGRALAKAEHELRPVSEEFGLSREELERRVFEAGTALLREQGILGPDQSLLPDEDEGRES